mmetsp:Transcript_41774/g.115117  ORF Transcript_41774/g.115117 Transcript_41774/m.115117 type:complete len:80 (-) Transcript_41774:457-696(-)
MPVLAYTEHQQERRRCNCHELLAPSEERHHRGTSVWSSLAAKILVKHPGFPKHTSSGRSRSPSDSTAYGSEAKVLATRL